MDTHKTLMEQMPQLPRLHYWKLVQGSERLYYLQVREAKRMVGRRCTGGVVASEPVLMYLRGAPVPWDMCDGPQAVLDLADKMVEMSDLL